MLNYQRVNSWPPVAQVTWNAPCWLVVVHLFAWPQVRVATWLQGDVIFFHFFWGGWLELETGRLPPWQLLLDVSENGVYLPNGYFNGEHDDHPMDLLGKAMTSFRWQPEVWTTTNSFAACFKVSKPSQTVCPWAAVRPSTTTPMPPAWAGSVLWWRKRTRWHWGTGEIGMGTC